MRRSSSTRRCSNRAGASIGWRPSRATSVRISTGCRATRSASPRSASPGWCRSAIPSATVTVVPYRAGETVALAPGRAAGARMTALPPITFATRFRGFLPVVMDLETGGFNSKTDALLEIAAVLIEMRSDGTLTRGETHRYHVIPFPGSNLEPASLAITGIDPHHPLRPAISEHDALQRIFRDVRTAVRNAECTRAVLVGPQRLIRLEFPECRGRAHADQAQSLPPVLVLRHRHLGRGRLRSDGADARHAWRRVSSGTRAPPTRPPTMRSAPRICSARFAINSKACSRRAGGASRRWGLWRSNPSPPRSRLPTSARKPAPRRRAPLAGP